MKFMILITLFLSSSAFATHSSCRLKIREAAKKISIINEGENSLMGTDQFKELGPETYRVSFYSFRLGKIRAIYDVEVVDAHKSKCLINSVIRQ